ncbi:MAG: cupin-like domain-containing protein [Spirulinaceae cyanobacterium]
MQTPVFNGAPDAPTSPQPTDSIHSIPRQAIADLGTQGFFEQYQQPGLPVVITDALAGAPTWDLAYLRQKIGDLTFLIRQFGRDRYQQDKRQWTSMGSGVESASMTFNDYAALVESGQAHAEDLYLAKFPITATPLAEDASLQQIPVRLPLPQPMTAWNLWVGPAGHTTCLHYDPFDGTLVQLHGSKRLVLFPPDQLYNLYPFPILNHLLHGAKLRSGYSQIYPDAIDFAAFPKAAQAQAHRYEVILNPGELIFIPAGWWHEISTVGEGMVCSVNRFWQIRPRARALRSWSKWRVHLASVLAVPHVAVSLARAIASRDQSLKLGQILQRL